MVGKEDGYLKEEDCKQPCNPLSVGGTEEKEMPGAGGVSEKTDKGWRKSQETIICKGANLVPV